MRLQLSWKGIGSRKGMGRTRAVLARPLAAMAVMAALTLSGCGPAATPPAADLTGTRWSDPKAPANTYCFWKDGACTAQYDGRTFPGHWTQSGTAVNFTIEGDGGPVLFRMVLRQNEMAGDGFPPGDDKSMFVNLVRLSGP